MFFISSLKQGGAERVASVLANYLSSSKFDIILVTFEKCENFYDILPNVKQICLDVYKNGINLKSKFKKLFFIRKTIKQHNPDCAISFLCKTNLSVIISSLFLKINLIISEHSHYKFSSKKERFLRRILYPFASKLVVLTKQDYKYYSFVKNKKIIYNPFFMDKKSLNLDKKENIMLFVGRLEVVKGCDIFLKALRLIDRKLLKKWEILIIGDGSQKEILNKEALNLNLKVTFIGKSTKVEDFYKKAKILVLPSRSEGLSNVLIEAIFFKVARIATKCSGPKELIKDRYTGLLCDIEDEKDLCFKMEMLMKDENLQEKLIQNAFLEKDKFCVENIVKQWIELIKGK